MRGEAFPPSELLPKLAPPPLPLPPSLMQDALIKSEEQRLALGKTLVEFQVEGRGRGIGGINDKRRVRVFARMHACICVHALVVCVHACACACFHAH